MIPDVPDPADHAPPMRRQLLAAEPETSALRAEYDRRLSAMIEVPLTRRRRACVIGVIVAAAGSAALFVALLATEPALPTRAKVAFGVGIAFAAGWILYAARILRRGTFNRRTDPVAGSAMAWAFTLTGAVLFAVAVDKPDPFVTFCFLFLLPAAVVLLRTTVEQSELRTRERLVELEYRLATLGRATPEPTAPPPPAP
jgi:MFS family permease